MPSECLLTNADHVLTGLYTQTVILQSALLLNIHLLAT